MNVAELLARIQAVCPLPATSQRVVQLAQDPAFREIVLDRVLAEPELEQRHLYPGRYYLRARTIEADGWRGAFGTPQQIDLSPTPRWPVVAIPFLLALVLPAGATPTPPDPQALAVASQVMEALGGEAAWKKIRFLRFDFAVETDGKIAMSRSHYWDKWTGRYRDSLGNRMTILGAANPEKNSNTREGQQGLDAEEVAHRKGSGHGIVVLDRAAQTVTFEMWRHAFDAAEPKPEDQFAGFPVTLPLSGQIA